MIPQFKLVIGVVDAERCIKRLPSVTSKLTNIQLYATETMIMALSARYMYAHTYADRLHTGTSYFIKL